MSFSVIVPAHNEEAFIGGCLESIARAAEQVRGPVECIVVLNACTDATESVARASGATVISCERRNLAAVRNAGAARATGDVLVTIDADSRMSPNMLVEVEKSLASGTTVGGGVPIVPERYSTGIVLTGLILAVLCLALGVTSAGLFWCRRLDFEAIGGFDEARHSGEDVEFARRLKRYGRGHGKRYETLRKTRIHTSCRKFDQFGDWFFVKLFLLHPLACRRVLLGHDAAMANRFWYAVGR